MSTVQEIEKAIQGLSRDDFFLLKESIEHRFASEWDKQFEDDVMAGSLDDLAEAALAEHRAGKSTGLPDDGK